MTREGWRSSRWLGLAVIVALVAAGLGTGAALTETRDQTFTTAVRLEILPGGERSIREAQDHYVKLLGAETDQPKPFEVLEGVVLATDNLDLWDPFFELLVTAATVDESREVASTAVAYLQADTLWPPEDPTSRIVVVREASTTDDNRRRDNLASGALVGLLFGFVAALLARS